jgi:hypothetical protein
MSVATKPPVMARGEPKVVDRVFAHGKTRNFTKEEYFELMEKQFEAYNRGDMDEFFRIGSQLPLDAYVAKGLRDVYGSRFIRKNNFDLTEAEMKWGKNWLDDGPEKGMFPYDYPGKP